MDPSPKQINIKEAAFVAIKSLAYISQSETELNKFLAITGIEAVDVIRLRENLQFLGGVLDFLSSDESLLLSFCSSEDFTPRQVENAKLRLAAPSI